MSDGIRIGIDEAGYGPRLGPLVVGCVRVEGEDPRRLERTLRRATRTLPAVRDSKKVFQGGLAPLETLTLALLGCTRGGRIPTTVGEVLGASPSGLPDHPWYEPLTTPVPLAATPGDVDAACATLARRVDRASARLTCATATVVLEGEFNQRVALASHNKSHLELEVIEDLIARHLPEDRPASVLCDRLGGRKMYGDWILAQFPFCQLDVEREHAHVSAYRLRRGSVHTTFQFLVGGEDRSIEIALASCLAKYTRELLMHLFNRYWSTHRTHLSPTAGYWSDAARWLSALAGDEEFERYRGRLVRER